MPVEVVGLEVQEHGNLAGELVHVLELEARELADDARARLDLAVEISQRPADVPGGRRVEDRAEQLGGRCLAVRAGDADEPRLQQPVAELDLAPDRDASPLGLGDERRLTRHTGALDEQLGAVEQREVAVVPKLAINGRHLQPAPRQRRDRPLPGAREPEHEHPLRQRAQRNPGK